jgi:hypothetical protein
MQRQDWLKRQVSIGSGCCGKTHLLLAVARSDIEHSFGRGMEGRGSGRCEMLPEGRGRGEEDEDERKRRGGGGEESWIEWGWMRRNGGPHVLTEQRRMNEKP